MRQCTYLCFQNTAFPVAGLSTPVILHYSDPEIQTGIAFGAECRESSAAAEGGAKSAASTILKMGQRIDAATIVVGQSPISPNEKANPVLISYSSSDDEQDFFDASEDVFTET